MTTARTAARAVVLVDHLLDRVLGPVRISRLIAKPAAAEESAISPLRGRSVEK
ncbi:hypothetical protein [Nocardia nova]|uniref:hypothetical protein n=1 Tax=Nocardia nova TaxID=37330 RepID=UPI0033C7FD13